MIIHPEKSPLNADYRDQIFIIADGKLYLYEKNEDSSLDLLYTSPYGGIAHAICFSEDFIYFTNNGFMKNVMNMMTGQEELSKHEDPGLYVVDGRKILRDHHCEPSKITEATVGINGLLKINFSSSRLFFL